MSLPVLIRPDADRDIREATDLFGSGFLSQVQEVLERIEWMLEMYGRVWQEVRGARLRRFRYVVFTWCCPTESK